MPDRSIDRSRSGQHEPAQDHSQAGLREADSDHRHEPEQAREGTLSHTAREARAQDQAELNERWPELGKAAEAQLKHGYSEIASAAGAAARMIDEAARRLDSDSVAALRAELDCHLDGARQDVAAARDAAQDRDGELGQEVHRALDTRREAVEATARCAEQMLQRTSDAVQSADASVAAQRDQTDTRTRDRGADDAAEREFGPKGSQHRHQEDQASERDTDELAQRWEELDASAEQALKDTYRGVTQQAEATRQEIDAVEEDLDESFNHAQEMLEVRHAKESTQSRTPDAELARRQADERDALANEREVTERTMTDLYQRLSVGLEQARNEVARQRDGQGGLDLQPLAQHRAELSRMHEEARDIRGHMAFLTRVQVDAAPEAAAEIKRDKRAAEAFLREALEAIVVTLATEKKHPLHFLVDKDTKDFVSRQRLDKLRPGVEIGHELSHNARSVERFMLEDADFNALAAQTVESRKKSDRGFILKPAVEIEGVVVDRRTAELWEKLDLLKLTDGRQVRDLPTVPGRSARSYRDERE